MINKFIFHPRKTISGYALPWENSEITLDINGQKLCGWWVKAENHLNNPLVIYFGGNAEDISINLGDIDLKENISYLYLSYRGFGKSSGKPSQEGLFNDALAVYDYIVSTEKIAPQQIFLVGRSIGSSIAAFLASHREVGGLVLITPFDSIANVAARTYPWLPTKFFLKNFFDTTKYLEKVRGKVLVCAAEKDEVIPRDCLEALISKHSQKLLLKIIKEANHQDITNSMTFHNTVNNYIHKGGFQTE